MFLRISLLHKLENRAKSILQKDINYCLEKKKKLALQTFYVSFLAKKKLVSVFFIRKKYLKIDICFRELNVRQSSNSTVRGAFKMVAIVAHSQGLDVMLGARFM